MAYLIYKQEVSRVWHGFPLLPFLFPMSLWCALMCHHQCTDVSIQTWRYLAAWQLSLWLLTRLVLQTAWCLSVPALSTILLSNGKTFRLVASEIWPKEMLQVGWLLHLLGRVSLAIKGGVHPSLHPGLSLELRTEVSVYSKQVCGPMKNRKCPM